MHRIFNESDRKDWEDIARYFSGEMDNEEKLRFTDRMNSSEINIKLMQQVKLDWNKMENYNNKNGFDADKAWKRLHAKFENEGLLNNPHKQFNIKRIWRVAAIFLFGILLASLAYYLIPAKENVSWQVADTYQNTQIKKIELPDGSFVYLNADSKLYYPDKFLNNNRIVEFEGDAFFEIAKNPDRPFIIKAKGAEIVVLGTSFNVNTNLEYKNIEVLVETGKVKLTVSEDKQKNVVLEPGFIGKVNKGQLSKQINTDKNYLSWKTKYFDFTDGIKLGEVIEILNRAYHANIICRDKMVCNKVLKTTFNNDSLDKILDLICNAHGLKMKTEKGEIVLSAL